MPDVNLGDLLKVSGSGRVTSRRQAMGVVDWDAVGVLEMVFGKGIETQSTPKNPQSDNLFFQ